MQLGYIFINSRNGTKLANIFQTVDGKTRIDFDAYLLSDLTYFDLFPPIRAEGGWDNSLELGVAWDSRDYEPYPTEGLYTELNLRYNAPFFNLYSYVLLNWKIQIYLPLYFLHPLKKAKVISAHRANFDWSFGDVPFYKMPRLGGNFDLRGYVDSRFFDYYSVYFNHEIRWRIAEHKLKRTRIYHTLVLFFDHGVVYNQEFNRQVQAENRWKISSGLEYLLTVDQNTHINLTLGASPETEIEHLNFTFGLRLMF